MFEYRRAIRAIIFDEHKKIAILNITNLGNYVLPGGGVERGESLEDTLHREILEETGTTIASYKPIGTVLEVRYRPHRDLGRLQLNQGFICELDKKLQEPKYTEDEMKNGYKVEWLEFDELIDLITNMSDQIEDFTKFARLRDLHFLQLVNEMSKL